MLAHAAVRAPPHFAAERAVVPRVVRPVIPRGRFSYFLVRTARFDPRGALSEDDSAAGRISGMRWWRREDIAEYGGTDLSSPRDIATPLAALIAGDIPGSPVMLGL